MGVGIRAEFQPSHPPQDGNFVFLPLSGMYSAPRLSVARIDAATIRFDTRDFHRLQGLRGEVPMAMSLCLFVLPEMEFISNLPCDSSHVHGADGQPRQLLEHSRGRREGTMFHAGRHDAIQNRGTIAATVDSQDQTLREKKPAHSVGRWRELQARRPGHDPFPSHAIVLPG